MSMISELVKGLRKLGNQWKHNDVAGFNLIFDAADTIETLSEKVRANNLHNGWIPVSERLPEKTGWYVVSVMGLEPITDMLTFYSEVSAWSDITDKQKVIAWMPLPEPYKGGDSE